MLLVLYGHYDKQPEFSGWDDNLDPWTPVIKDGKLYGRGGADDGYALFRFTDGTIRALQEQGIPHAHCVVIVEGCEESGSFDLPYYIDMLKDQNRVAESRSLPRRRVRQLRPALVHDVITRQPDRASCVSMYSPRAYTRVPPAASCRRASVILQATAGPYRRSEATVTILLEGLHADIPGATYRAGDRRRLRRSGAGAYEKFPWAVDDPSPSEPNEQLLLNNTWNPTLSITGADGLPALVDAGNVLLPFNTLKLSFRLPPTCDADRAAEVVRNALEADPPPLCNVEFEVESTMAGWNAPAVDAWLEASMHKASEAFFGKPSMYMGTGGTIPFMGMLGEKFPEAQFLITGLLGPKSNAHGPNEFLHIDTGKRVTSCVAQVLEDHFTRDQ